METGLKIEPREKESFPEVYQIYLSKEDKKNLAIYCEEEKKEILKNKRILSSLVYHIGKDFKMPIKINNPGGGWYWDPEKNEVKVDPKDLINKPIDYPRFVMAHEAAHRRISRASFIPQEIRETNGFWVLINSIEDPKVNNFLAENYPMTEEQKEIALEGMLDIEKEFKKRNEEMGREPPMSVIAGFEYIKQSFAEQDGKEREIDKKLPKEVQEVLRKTLSHAKDAWWRYPSKKEADKSEDIILEYCKSSYKIILEKIWPEFKKLVDSDIQEKSVEEFLDQLSGEGDSEEQGKEKSEMRKEIEEKLSEKEKEELKGAIEEREKKDSKEDDAEDKKQPDDKKENEGSEEKEPKKKEISEELKEKIKEHIETIEKTKKEEIQKKAKEKLKEIEKEFTEELEAKMEGSLPKTTHLGEELFEKAEILKTLSEEARDHESKELKSEIEKKLSGGLTIYEKMRSDILPIIDKVENELREIFIARRSKWEDGYRTGKKISIKKRIQEKAKGVSAVESKAWQKKELPAQKDYAISLLVDLSGSMHGEKIYETFKAVIVLNEVLNRLSINTEILGFNEFIYEYQSFKQPMSQEIRDQMGSMLREVTQGPAQWNDDGWALKETSERLNKQKETEKFLIILSDGEPAPSYEHRGWEYRLENIIEDIAKNTDQKLIGLGIGPGTEHVEEFYPNSLISHNINNMADNIAELIKEIIINYNRF